MQNMRESGAWFETIGLSLVAVFLYQTALLLLLFLVPGVILIRRRGEVWYGIGALITVAVMGLFRYAQLARVGAEHPVGLALGDIALPVLLLAGVYLMGRRQLWGFTGLYRLGLATLGTGILSIPVLVPLVQSGSFENVLEGQFRLALQALGGTAQVGPESVEQFARLGLQLLLGSYLAFYMALVGLNWYIGGHMAARFFQNVQGAPRFRRFILPSYVVWVLLVGAVGVFVDMVGGIGALRYVAWNAVLASLVLYGAQGIGIIRFLFDRYNMSQGARIGIGIALIVGLFIPALNLVVLLGIPGLGISELWVRYGRLESPRSSG
jgi:hypothetical protein